MGKWSNGRGEMLAITAKTIQFASDKPVTYSDVTKATNGQEFNLEVTSEGKLNYLTKYLHVSTGEGDKPDEMKMTLYNSRKDLEEAKKNAKGKGGNVTLAAPLPAPGGDPKKEEIQGVFIVNGKKALFHPVKTGISGVTDIEITEGLQPGDEIVVGSYKALRTLKPEAPIKVDNSAPKKTDEQS